MVYKVWNRNENKWEMVKTKSVNYGKSNTDKSKYRPNVSELTGASGSSRIGIYDFADGKDNGTRLYGIRNKGADVVELTKYAEKEIARGNEIKKKILEDVLEEVKNNDKKTTETNATETENTTKTE